MFGFLKADPVKKLEKEYRAKLKLARDIQRRGDVLVAGQITAEAEEIANKIELIKNEDNG